MEETLAEDRVPAEATPEAVSRAVEDREVRPTVDRRADQGVLIVPATVLSVPRPLRFHREAIPAVRDRSAHPWNDLSRADLPRANLFQRGP